MASQRSDSQYTGILQLRLTPAAHRRVTERAASEDRSVSSWLRQLVMRELSEHDISKDCWRDPIVVGPS